MGNRLGPDGDIMYVYVFSAVGFFILLIAIINFINLSTARGTKRAKEVGVKKTLGVLRKSLVLQFQIEHILMAFAAMLLGLGNHGDIEIDYSTDYWSPKYLFQALIP